MNQRIFWNHLSKIRQFCYFLHILDYHSRSWFIPLKDSLSPPRIIISSPLLHLKASYSSSSSVEQASRVLVLKNPIISSFPSSFCMLSNLLEFCVFSVMLLLVLSSQHSQCMQNLKKVAFFQLPDFRMRRQFSIRFSNTVKLLL